MNFINIKKLILLFSKFSLVGVFMTFLSLVTAYIFLEILHTPLFITYALNYLITIFISCLLYTSDAADDLLCVDLGGRRIIKKKKK